MNFIVGIICGLLVASSYVFIYNKGKKSNKNTVEPISNEEIEKRRKLQEGFNNVMNYDINVALGKEGN